MSDQVVSDLSLSQAGLLATLERLSDGRAPSPDPLRLHYLQALARRMQAAAPAVQPLLQARLQQALAEMPEVAPGQGVAAQPAAPRPPIRGAAAQEPATPLGRLNAHIANAALVDESEGLRSGADRRDLRSARRFRETWALISAETQVDQAVHRGPENAGPLNSHSLMLRTLGLMRELSPDYLRCFLAHADTLLWLEQAYGQLKQPAGKAKAARAGKPKK
jgi:hypothetical protein